MGLFPTDAENNDEVTNANGTTFKYVAVDDKWIVKGVEGYSAAEVDALIADFIILEEAHAYIEATALTMENVITFHANQLFDAVDISDLKDAFDALDYYTTGQVDANTYTRGQVDGLLHTRLHTITNTSDHSANYWKLFYSDAAGEIQEIATGASATVLTGNGVGAAPSFQAAGGGGGESLDETFDIGKIIDGASSDGNSMDIGDGAYYINFYTVSGSYQYWIRCKGNNAFGDLIIQNDADKIYLKPSGDTDDYTFWFTTDGVPAFGVIGGNVFKCWNGVSYVDFYADLKDQASNLVTGTLEKVKKIKSIGVNNEIDYASLPEDIEIIESPVYELEFIRGSDRIKKDIDGNPIETGKTYLTDVGDMMYFNLSAIKELLERQDTLEARIKELEDI